MHPYFSPYEHLLDELERVFLMTEIALRRQWTTPGLQSRITAGLSRIIGESEITAAATQHERIGALTEQLADLDRSIAERVARTLQSKTVLPLVEIRRLFDLDTFQVDILLLALACEIDPRFAPLFQYLQDDRARRWIDVCTVAEIICTNSWMRGRLFSDLSEDGPLVSHHLVDLSSAEPGVAVPLLYRSLKVSQALVGHVVGAATPGSRQEVLHPVGPPLSELASSPATRVLLPRLERAFQGAGASAVLVVAGRAGVGKRALVRALAHQSGRRVLELGLCALSPELGPFVASVKAWLLRGLLSGHVCYATELDELLPDGGLLRGDPRAAALVELLDAHVGLVALGSRHALKTLYFRSRAMLHVEVEMPDEAMREIIWRRELNVSGVWLPADQVRELATRFFVSGGTVRDAVRLATDANPGGGPGQVAISHEALAAMVGDVVRNRLDKLARRVAQPASWSELVVPSSLEDGVRSLISRHRYRTQVLKQWGYGQRLRMQTGVSALLWGPPGTGKSLTAALIAAELGLTLYQVDLAMVMSKWLGETERNLAQIFDEAESGDVLLLFDEADSLFAKRTSGDEGANEQAIAQRVNFILTRLESFRGFTVLTSNRETAIDEAFERRLSAKLYFPTPDKPLRESLWRHMLGDGVIFDDGLLERIADIELAGGHIRKASANAAFDAASRGEQVGSAHVLRALHRLLEDRGSVPPGWLNQHAGAR
jgi:Mrp family chromosome partitioning ATPase